MLFFSAPVIPLATFCEFVHNSMGPNRGMIYMAARSPTPPFRNSPRLRTTGCFSWTTVPNYRHAAPDHLIVVGTALAVNYGDAHHQDFRVAPACRIVNHPTSIGGFSSYPL